MTEDVKKKAKKKKKSKYPGVRERDGRYTFRYSVPVVINDKKTRKQKETESYATALEAYEAGILIRASQISGSFVDEKNITFAQWADKFLEIYIDSGSKDQSVVTRKSQFNRLKRKFGPIKLKDITALQYQEYLFSLKKEGLKKNTVLGQHAAMSLLMKKASNPPYELISKDITTSVNLPDFKDSVEKLKTGKAKVKYLEKDELVTFIKTAYLIAERAPTEKEVLMLRQNARVLDLLVYSGLRIGEMCGLDEEEIDLENHRINVIATLNVQHGIESYILDTPKNKPSIREVDVTKYVTDRFRKQMTERKRLKLMFGSNYYKVKDNFIFRNARAKPGCPLSPLEVARYMTEVLQEANLPIELTPHKLRHTYTSLSAEAGIELSAIQRQLGHANDAKTTLVYNHVTKARRRTDMQKLEDLINGIEM
ncbi:hypothetical protein B2I21_07340 [Chryseobacterium mucoviscidosis]|nr:hypothetical protein B2I21_07340 [Chryseobacterium mucoviscidosis]